MSVTTPVGHEHAHHFQSAEHEYATGKEGVWLFLVTELMMFGGLFLAYVVFRSLYPEMWAEGSKHLNRIMGGINTLVLITSSLTMALSIHYIQVNKRDKAMMNLGITLACAFMFLVIKYFEYTHKIHVGTLPSKFWHFEGAQNPNLPLFFGVYFVMTGLHGIHVLAGMGLITWLMIRLKRGEFGPRNYTAVEGVGLFWHVVDLIWIFLFPLFYLL